MTRLSSAYKCQLCQKLIYVSALPVVVGFFVPRSAWVKCQMTDPSTWYGLSHWQIQTFGLGATSIQTSRLDMGHVNISQCLAFISLLEGGLKSIAELDGGHGWIFHPGYRLASPYRYVQSIC